MPKRPLEDWWQSLFPGTPAQVPRRSYGSRMRGDSRLSTPPTSGRGYVHPADTPLASGRAPYDPMYGGRWVTFGRAPRSRAYNPSYVPITNDPDSAMFAGRPRGIGARVNSANEYSWNTPDSTPAPTESEGSAQGIMQALEVESPLAVPEATSFAFAPWLVEIAATAAAAWLYSQIVPKGRDPADWNDRIIDWINKHLRPHPAPVPRTVISGTSQPKAVCRPGFPNKFTHGLGSPIALSA